MIITLTGVAALLLSILLIFTDSIIITALLIALSILFIVYGFVLKKVVTSHRGSEDSEESREDLLNENKRLAARLKEIEDISSTLRRESDDFNEKNENLLEDAAFLCTALPLMKKLATLIIDKTEESAMNLTENIFQISSKSSKVGTHISNFLNDMFSGDKSLKNNIDILNGEMNRINKLIDDFTSIKKRYTEDMKHIEENVQVINSYLSGIRDVSDRTGLLAINSSIEAARVGNAGKGFSVLAGEIQGLARSSKEISLQIDEIVTVIANTVEQSFSTLESEITITLDELSRTRLDLLNISSNLNDKVSDVEEHVKHTDSLSKTVTEQLNNVTVNMQYQDITRQILEHIMCTLTFYRNNLEDKAPDIVSRTDVKERKNQVIEQASSYFTIEDEWKLFGLEAEFETSERDGEKKEFKGNVEMF